MQIVQKENIMIDDDFSNLIEEYTRKYILNNGMKYSDWFINRDIIEAMRAATINNLARRYFAHNKKRILEAFHNAGVDINLYPKTKNALISSLPQSLLDEMDWL